MKHADKSKRTRNLCNAAMLCCAAAVLLTGLGRTLLRPKDVNYYENRPANTVAPLTAESWLDGSFQDAMEAALSDQIPLAQAMKKTFNDAQNKIRYDSMMRLSHRYPNVPVQYDQFLVYGGKYLAYAYCSPDNGDTGAHAAQRKPQCTDRRASGRDVLSLYGRGRLEQQLPGRGKQRRV